MGRKNSALKNKGSAAVPLPHDGPLHAALCDDSQNLDDGKSGLHTALVLLRANPEPGSPDPSNDSIEALTFDLCYSLRTAKTSKDQLQALQSYRSKLLNLRNNKNEEIFTEQLAKDLVMMKQYDLSKFDKGKYTVVAKTANRSFNEIIEIK